MNLDEHEAWQVLYCCGEELRARREGKRRGVQPWLVNLVRRLELEVAVSQSRQDETCDLPSSNHDQWISTRQAAAILGWTTRTVQRRASDLEGRMVGRHLVFQTDTVLEFAEALNDVDHARS